jgi:hypothetical protein
MNKFSKIVVVTLAEDLSNTIFDNIILGDGPISRTLLYHLNNCSIQNVLVLDAGNRIEELVEKIEIVSNFNYDSPLRAPSFHIAEKSRVWFGGCQGWPSSDSLGKSIDSLPIAIEGQEYLDVINKILKELRIFNYDPTTSRLFFSLERKYRNLKNIDKLSFTYCKVLNDPYLKRIMKKNKKDSKNTFASKIIITKIIPESEYVRLIGVDSFGRKVKFLGKNIHLSLGTIENTRLLLNSQKELNLGSNQYLGNFLSDHLSISIRKISTKNVSKIVRDFSRTSTLDGSLLWPRVSLGPSHVNQFQVRSFVHASHFEFDGKIPLLYKFLRKIRKENYFFYWAKTGSFQLNFFFEKLNNINNSITLRSFTEYDIAPIRIAFNILEDEYLILSQVAGEYLQLLNEKYSFTVCLNNLISEFNKNLKSDLRASVHPSGTYRMSINQDFGVVNNYSELWNDSRIRVLGAGVLPRSSSTHPTLISMTLARMFN